MGMAASTSLLALAVLASLALGGCDLGLPHGDDAAGDDAAGDDAADDDDGGDESSDSGADETDGPPAPTELLGVWTIEGTTAAAAFALADDGTYARANVG